MTQGTPTILCLCLCLRALVMCVYAAHSLCSIMAFDPTLGI